MSTLQVSWAHECAPPGFARKKRVRGSKAAGLTYERKLAKVLPRQCLHGQWFIYEAEGGVKYCQPDFLLKGFTELAVLEVKLGDVAQGWDQLMGLYEPVLCVAYGRRSVLKVVVTKSLARLPDVPKLQVCETLRSALQAARVGYLPVLHWLGTGRV